jgi:hypothetical protein
MLMFSSKKHSITLIVCGSRPSPFMKSVDDMNYAVNYIFNNSCDFTIEHPDPAKRLSYHHELFSLLEKKVQEYKQLNDILKLLASTFDSFNPMMIPPVINMLGRYASHFENRADQHSFYMQLASIFHVNQGSIYPLFKSTPPIIVDDGKSRLPLRQYILEFENKVRIPSKKGNGEGKGTLGDVNQPIIADGIRITPTSIVDAQLCDAIRDPFVSSAGVVIVPTDFISTYFIFSCPGFRQLLKGFDKKVTLISPTWAGNDITPVEREVLNYLVVPTLLEPFLKIVMGDLVDTVILPKRMKDENLESSQLTKEYAIFPEDLSPTSQHSHEFFHLVLKTLDIEHESLRIDTLKERVDLSEKIASSLKQYKRIF